MGDLVFIKGTLTKKTQKGVSHFLTPYSTVQKCHHSLRKGKHSHAEQLPITSIVRKR